MKKNFILEGSLLIFLGFLAILWPQITSFAFEYAIGTLFLIAGLFQTFRLFHHKQENFFLPSFIIAILFIIAGLLLFIYPLRGLITLTFLLTALFIAQGIFQITLGLKVKPSPVWGIWTFNGLLAMLIGLFIWFGWPANATWIIGLLIGINMIFFGLSQIIIGVSLPKS